MRALSWAICIAAAGLLGCHSNGGGSKGTSYNYPDNLKDMCIGTRNNARGCIEAKGGTALKEPAKSLSVEVRPGEKRFSGGQWGWRAPEWGNQWVVGLTYTDGPGRYRILVAADPKTMQGVQPTVVEHEHGHYWLLSNFNDGSHNPKFKSCFGEWRDLRVRCQSIVKADGNIVVVDFIDEED